MTDSGTLAVMPIQRQNELPFRPFHSGSLQLSVYRSTSVDPKRYDASRNYPAVLGSFIKRRPLSEVFASPISNLDLSSSSDEDLTDPVPESPLNLSDAESMASGQSSPFLFPRRRKAGRHDARPRSLYDAAKPHPPPRNAPEKGGKIDPSSTISDKLGRLINRRPWKHYREPKQDMDASNSYERGCEPVPEAGNWTNVVGSNPTRCDEPAKHTPHPPTNPAPAPRKKRQAPKPPTALPRSTPTESAVEATPLHAMPGTREPVTSDTENDKHTDTPTATNDIADDSSRVMTPVEGQISLSSATPQYSALAPGDTPIDTSETHPPGGYNTSPAVCAVPRVEQSNDADATDVGTSSTVPSEQPDVTMQDVVKETVTEATDTPPSASPLVKNLCATLLSIVSNAEQNAGEESGNTDEIEAGSRVKMPDAANSLPTQEEKSSESYKMEEEDPCDVTSGHENADCVDISANEHFNNDVTDGSVDDTIDNARDDVVAINLTPPIPEDAGSILKHADPSENASSGYSSPGSGDEGPASPEPVTSPVTLGVPSPTSSYYSTSLSASSSRVSNMSRELTLTTTPCGCKESEKVAKTHVGKGPLVHHLATDINMNDVPAKGRSQSESVMPTTETRSQTTNKNVSADNDTLLPEKSGRKLSDPMLVTGDIAAVPPFAGSLGYSTQSVVLRSGSRARVRPRSEFVPSSREREEWRNELNRVSICMVERPGDSAKLASQYPAGLFKAPQPKVKGPSKKKALAAAQKSRAFAMRARVQLSKRHSYAESSDYFLGDEPSSGSEVPSSNLVSHFVSTRNISTYYDGTDQRVVTPQEILTSKREEFFNAFRNTHRHNDQFGGSVQHLPVSAKEFAIQDVIPEVNEVESPVKPVNPIVPESPVSAVSAPEQTSSPVTSPESIQTGYSSENKENEITVHRQSSGASSSGSSANQSSVYAGSTWSLSTEMTTNQSVRMRKPSLRRRLQGAFSFQNIRRAISMEKLSEEEKRRSMSHHYINEAGSHDLGNRSATLSADSRAYSGEERVKKSSSIMNMFPSVRMRKRRSRMNKDARNRYTISGPEELPDNGEVYNKRSSMRPMSLIVPSSQSHKKPDRVGDPSFFRPIGRVLQMNPAEGTLLVEMVKPPSGPFGFYIARKKEAGDTGSVYISRLSDSYPDKMFAGLMRTGDEITEVNGTDVSGLTLDQVYDLILDSDRTLLKIKPSQVHVV